MAEFQPPEGLREIVAKAISIYDWDNGISANPEIGQHQRGEAAAALAALFEACEVREELGVRIAWNDGDSGDDLWLNDQAAIDRAVAHPGTGLTASRIRRLVITTPPVSSTGDESDRG